VSELAQIHTLEELDFAALKKHVRLDEQDLDRRAWLRAGFTRWRPCDIWDGAPVTLCWTMSFETPAGRLFRPAVLDQLRGRVLTGSPLPLHPAEQLARGLGGGLVTVFSDGGKIAYCAMYREHRLRWSLYLQDGVRLVRCDGAGLTVQEPPGPIPEGDRLGVLLAGFRQWLREPLDLGSEDRLTMPDTLDSLVTQRYDIVRDGLRTQLG
jgi:hypothetical protein